MISSEARTMSMKGRCVVHLNEFKEVLLWVKERHHPRYLTFIEEKPVACNYLDAPFQRAVINSSYFDNDKPLEYHLKLRDVSHQHQIVLENEFADRVEETARLLGEGALKSHCSADVELVPLVV